MQVVELSLSYLDITFLKKNFNFSYLIVLVLLYVVDDFYGSLYEMTLKMFPEIPCNFSFEN